jgi:hypothetical protein
MGSWKSSFIIIIRQNVTNIVQLLSSFASGVALNLDLHQCGLREVSLECCACGPVDGINVCRHAAI